MPAAHLAARREQIMVAAMERFADGGFHSTGMAEVIAASGLSAGAVYRYFASKDELIRAIIHERVLTPAAAAFAHAVDSGLDDPAEAVAAAVGIVERAGAREGVDVTRIALHAWAESLRDAQIRALAQEAYSTMRGYLAAVADRAQQGGKAGLGSTPDEIAKAMLSLVIGYLMQRLVTQDVAAGAYVEAVRSLLGRPAAESAALTAGAAAGSGRLPT